MKLALAIHGGAGPIDAANPAAPCFAERGDLRRVATSAWAMLQGGANALDVVEAAVALLEDGGLFNAGRGAVRNRDGDVELDASIMDGRDARAGAVAAVRTARNPIRLARAVLQQGDHVMLAGAGADRFCVEHRLPVAAADYFIVPRSVAPKPPAGTAARATRPAGTVGAVARDKNGHLAAATSTGGMAGKLPGRVGDSPLIGAGTWASNATCAISATGDGEYFIRAAVAHDVHARVRYASASLADAARDALAAAAELGGRGGLIALGRTGPPILPFLTHGMYRAWIDPAGRVRVAVYDKE